ncbi:MAG: IclR family transcriptional regulator [Gemmatimonadaceae bacterium]
MPGQSDVYTAFLLESRFVLKQLDDILALFSREHPELTVLDAAARLHRPRSTTYRLMAQIEKAGFLDRDEETGRYRLGIRLAALGELAQSSTSLQRITHPVLRRLSQQTGETATLLVLMDGEGYAVLHSESSQRVVAKGVLGRHWPLHASAGGKTLLAWCPEDQQKKLLKKPLKRYTETTIADLALLQRELRQIRERGYATVRGEYMDDVWGVAVPIFNHREELDGALTLGGPRSRVTRALLPELGKILISAGDGVSRSLGYESAYPRTTASGDASRMEKGNGALVTRRGRPSGGRSRA